MDSGTLGALEIDKKDKKDDGVYDRLCTWREYKKDLTLDWQKCEMREEKSGWVGMRETTDKAKRHSRHKHIDTSLLVYVGENEIWI